MRILLHTCPYLIIMGKFGKFGTREIKKTFRNFPSIIFSDFEVKICLFCKMLIPKFFEQLYLIIQLIDNVPNYVL